MNLSKIFFYLCLSFIFGIALASYKHFSQILILGLLILGIFLVSVFWEHKKVAWFGLILIVLVSGLWRYQSVRFNNQELYLGEQSFTGIIVKEPDVRADNVKLTVEIKKDYRILATTSKYPEYGYGDKITISGKIQEPQIFDEFNYREYLIKDGIYSVVYYPKIELLSQGSGPYRKLLEFKDNLRNSIYTNLSLPASSVLGAMILGDKSRMSESLKQDFSRAGVRHITAVSGLHVAILTNILMVIFLGLGFWRKQAFWFTIFFVFLFVVLTGLQSSALRAGLMGGFLLIAQYLGKMNSSHRAVVFAAVILLGFNPLLLKLDVGFQLSFLAMIGIIYFLSFFQSRLSFMPKFVKDIIAMTLSAQVFTLPLLIYNFGYISIASLVANILIVPLLPFVMISGFIFALLGLISSFLGWIFSFVSWFLLSYILKVVEIFSSFPIIQIKISWAWLIFCYLVLSFIAWRVNKKEMVFR